MTFDLDIIRCTILDLSCLEAVPGLYDLRFKSYTVFAKVDFQKGEISPISSIRIPSTRVKQNAAFINRIICTRFYVAISYGYGGVAITSQNRRGEITT